MTKTTLQKVEEFRLDQLDKNYEDHQESDHSFASALLSRINRQKKPLIKVEMEVVPLLNNTGINATILQNAAKVKIGSIISQSDFGGEG